MTLDLDALPRRLDRKDGAALITQHFFKVAPRSLERWPLREVYVNRRVMLETSQLIAEAERRLAAAGPAPDQRRSATASSAPESSVTAAQS
jgi:hypothetical protein